MTQYNYPRVNVVLPQCPEYIFLFTRISECHAKKHGWVSTGWKLFQTLFRKAEAICQHLSQTLKETKKEKNI